MNNSTNAVFPFTFISIESRGIFYTQIWIDFTVWALFKVQDKKKIVWSDHAKEREHNLTMNQYGVLLKIILIYICVYLLRHA